MKNIFRIIVTLSIVGITLTACEKDDPIEMIIPQTTLTFDGDLNKRSGTYYISGLVEIVVGVEGAEATAIEVSSRYSRVGDTSPKVFPIATIPVTGGQATFSHKAREIVDEADVQDNTATLATGKIRPTGAFTLIFDVVLEDGSRERRFFTANISNSISFTPFSSSAPTVNPATYFNDSTYSLKFTLQNPASARVTNVKVFRKLGSAAEEALPVFDVDYDETTNTIVDEYLFEDALAFPSQTGIPAYTGVNYAPATAANRTLAHRFVVTTAVGETNSFTVFNVVNTPVPLNDAVRTLSFSTAAGGLLTWDLGTRFNPVTDADADLVFSVTGTGFDKQLNLGSDPANATEFVRLNPTFDYTNASYNSIRDAYNAGTPATSVTNLVLGDIIVVNVGDIDDSDRTNYKVLKVTALQRDAVGNSNTLGLEYKSVQDPQ